jgi:UDP-N-acetylmuramoylalanine--D-glutamate ligase
MRKCVVALCMLLIPAFLGADPRVKEGPYTYEARMTYGDIVLLSPGGTSFDEFRDFEERGEAYRKWVSELS